MVQGTPGHRRHRRKPESCRRWRKLRMDGHVRRLRQDRRRRRLPRPSKEVPHGCCHRKGARRTLPRPPQERGNRTGVRKERSQGLGMPQLRTHCRGHEGPGSLPRLRPPAILLRSPREQLLIVPIKRLKSNQYKKALGEHRGFIALIIWKNQIVIVYPIIAEPEFPARMRFTATTR